MKIGLSSSVCPQWDLQTLVQQAKAIGYQALELCAPSDRQESPVWSSLADGSVARRVLADADLELTCLATPYALHWSDRRTLQDHKKRVQQALDLAGRLGCKYVSIKAGSVPRFQRRDRVLLRVVEGLRELAPLAAESRVTLLVENDANIAGSRDLWFVTDAASHPSVRCCWNPSRAQAAGDFAGLAVPRIGRNICVTHLQEAFLASTGAAQDGSPLGQGQVELARFLILMHGIGSGSRLIVQGPASGGPSDPGPFLQASLAWLRAELDKIAAGPELSAYKGDKNAPRFASPGQAAAASATA